jgi:hypothetical protein
VGPPPTRRDAPAAAAGRLRTGLRRIRDRPAPARRAAPSGGAAGARAPARPWHFRGADLDLAGHVNNAVYWGVLEDELVADEPAAGMVAEIEHRASTGAGESTVRSDGAVRWIADPAGTIVATLTVAPLG